MPSYSARSGNDQHSRGLPHGSDIATFVHVSHTDRGIGTDLFRANCPLAKKLGYNWINATIRLDNEKGLGFYQSRGFQAYADAPVLELPSGQVVGRVSMQFQLK
ncbi:MAG: GNAT family N-acetyltransferase [Pseudomonadota bacterium]